MKILKSQKFKPKKFRIVGIKKQKKTSLEKADFKQSDQSESQYPRYRDFVFSHRFFGETHELFTYLQFQVLTTKWAYFYNNYRKQPKSADMFSKKKKETSWSEIFELLLQGTATPKNSTIGLSLNPNRVALRSFLNLTKI